MIMNVRFCGLMSIVHKLFLVCHVKHVKQKLEKKECKRSDYVISFVLSFVVSGKAY